MFSVFWSNVLTVPLLCQVGQHSTFYLMYEHIGGIEHWTHGPATSIMTIISIYCILEGSGPLLVKIEEARHCQYFIMISLDQTNHWKICSKCVYLEDNILSVECGHKSSLIHFSKYSSERSHV